MRALSTCVLCGLFAGMLALAGCEKEDTVKPSAGSTPPAPSVAGEQAKDALGAAAAKAQEAGSTMVAEAQKMIDQVKQYISEKKFSDAETLLTKLDGMRAQLPESVQKMIDDCKQMLAKAKG